MKIKLTKEQTRDLWREELENYELVEDGDWIVDHKYQHCTMIVKDTVTGKFFEYSVSRSGSPFSDYYYSFEDVGTELVEVEKVSKTVMVTTWEQVGE